MKRSILALTFGLVAALGGTANAELSKNPAPGTMESTLLEGLKLIRDGKFDDWVSKYCGKRTLCWNNAKIAEYKRYNLPASKRIVGACLREDGHAIDIDRVEPQDDGSKKVFIKCRPDASPRPYYLEKEGEKWVFTGTGIY